MATGEAMFKYCGRLNSGPFTHDHVLIPGICEYVTWRGKRDSANEKLRSWDGKVMLLILSRFSRVRLHRRQPTRLTHPWDSPGKNTGVGCHFLLQCMKVKSQSEVAQSSLTLSDPMDCSHPGFSVHGILQARTLEWVAISFSNAWKWKGKVKLLSCVQLLATPWTAAHQAPPSMGFSRQEYCSGVPSPSPEGYVTGINVLTRTL